MDEVRRTARQFAVAAAFGAATALWPGSGSAEDTATAKKADSLEIADLIGVWDVSLFFAPDAAPSSTVLEVTEVDNGAVTGTFYGSPFVNARAVMHKGAVIFSAVTEDGTGPYAHGMRMHAPDFIYGQTLSTGRDFVMAWEATRRADNTED